MIDKDFKHFLAICFYFRDKLEESNIIYVSNAGKNIEWQGNNYIQANLFFDYFPEGVSTLKMHFLGGSFLIDEYLKSEFQKKELRMKVNILDINKLNASNSESTMDVSINKIEKDLVNNIYTFFIEKNTKRFFNKIPTKTKEQRLKI